MEKLEKSNEKISIIIPTLNEEKFLPDLLDRINKQSYKNIEIIVSDANSTDKTREIAKNNGAIVVDGGSISVGRNNGAKIASGKILVFMDADIEFSDNFIENCLEDFSKNKLDVAITFFSTKNQDLGSKFLYKLSDFTKLITQKLPNKFGTCQCIFIKTETFSKIGGFTEEIEIGEDVDFMRKISKKDIRYGILGQKIKASDRRFNDFGVLRILIASIFIGLIISLGIYRKQNIQSLIQKMYGGWGKW